MRTFEHIQAIRTYIRAAREDGKTIGFVPTMGALHLGHATLMRRARADCDVLVASIFVNPTQFAPGEDYDRYPRDLTADSRVAQAAGVDALFTPSVDEMYPPGAQTVVDVPDLAHRWEGEARPGHFKGVATVCTRLFNIVQPDRAYFGRKDYQQLKVVEQLVADLAVPVSIVPVANVRDPDGLALSSRNRYLEPAERQAASVLYRALQRAEQLFTEGERSAKLIEFEMKAIISEEELVKVEYAVAVDAETLEPCSTLPEQSVALIAAKIGAVRLIDNHPLGNHSPKNARSKP